MRRRRQAAHFSNIGPVYIRAPITSSSISRVCPLASSCAFRSRIFSRTASNRFAELASPIVRPLEYFLPSTGATTISHSSFGFASFPFIDRRKTLSWSGRSQCSASMPLRREPSIISGSPISPGSPR